MKCKINRIMPFLAWLTVAFFVFFQFYLQTSSSIMSQDWALNFHLNKVELSNLSAAFFYSYVLLQLPIGVFYDRFQAKHILIIAAALLSLGCIMLSMVDSYAWAVVARLLMGIGSAFGFVGLLTVIIISFPANRFGLMLGLAELLGMAGVALGTIVLAHLMLNGSWRSAMFGSGIIAAVLALVIVFAVHTPKTTQKKPPFSLTSVLLQVKSVLCNKQIILCSIYGFFIYSIITAFTSLWGVEFLTNTYHMDSKLASTCISTIIIGLALGSPINGLISKKYGNNAQMMRWEALLATVILGIIILVHGIPPLLLFVLFFLIGFLCSVYVQCLSVIKDSVVPGMQATALAASNMMIISSAPLLQILIGGILQSHFFGLALNTSNNYRCSLAILPLGYLIAWVFSFFIRDLKSETNS